ncbi:MAG: efflux RND transporter periplasmic adaptor subunit [Treponema sp.]|jgi:RND family efflux transporter MFP subunit|nr:efflux RND transporter periplasmic adaptor subunit [Treponema sp.]
MNSGKLFLAFMASCMVIGISCENKKQISIDTTPLSVQTINAERKQFTEDLTAFGSISFKSKNDITALVEGTITALEAKEGDSVRKGQVLARLRNVQLEIQKEQAKNAIESAQSSINLLETKLRETRLGIESRLLSLEKTNIMINQKELELEKIEIDVQNSRALLAIGGVTEASHKTLELSYKSSSAELDIMLKDKEVSSLGLTDRDLIGAGIQPSDEPAVRKEQLIHFNTQGIMAEIDSAKANLRNAQNSLASVESMIAELVLHASADGVVGARYYENGEFVKQNEKVFTLIETAEVYAVFYIQEQDIINYFKGSPLEIEVPSIGEKIAAKIDEISPIADAQSGNFSVKALIHNQGGAMKPGMFVKCVIPRADAVYYIALPQSALTSQANGAGIVFCVVNNIAVQKEVAVHSLKDGIAWIRNGINEQDLIIDKPSPFLKEGSYVSVR